MIITLCGPRKHEDMMMNVYNALTLEGNTVFLPYLGNPFPEDKVETIHHVHDDKIKLSDEIWVIDILDMKDTLINNPYVGKDTTREIHYARDIGVRVRFLSSLVKETMYDDPLGKASVKLIDVIKNSTVETNGRILINIIKGTFGEDVYKEIFKVYSEEITYSRDWFYEKYKKED